MLRQSQQGSSRWRARYCSCRGWKGDDKTQSCDLSLTLGTPTSPSRAWHCCRITVLSLVPRGNGNVLLENCPTLITMCIVFSCELLNAEPSIHRWNAAHTQQQVSYECQLRAFLSPERLLRDFSRFKLWAVKIVLESVGAPSPGFRGRNARSPEILLLLENAPRMQGLWCTCFFLPSSPRS